MAKKMVMEKSAGEKQKNPPIPFKVEPQLPNKVIRGGSSKKTLKDHMHERMKKSKGSC